MDVLQGVTIALLVIAALGGLLAVAQRRGLARFGSVGTAGSMRMEVLERVSLTPHHSVHLIRVDGRLLVVSNGPGGSSMKFTDEEGEER